MGKMTQRGPDLHNLVFIWIYLITIGLFCRAQQVNLVNALVDDMQAHFCNKCDGISDCNLRDQRCPLCRQICATGNNRRSCWNETDNICSNGGFSTTVCGYRNAVVCQTASDAYCVFRFCSNRVPFCTDSLRTPYMYNSNPEWARNRCIESTTEVNLMSTEDGQSSSPGYRSTTIALACVLSIVLLLVILGAGFWYLRRRGKLPAFMTKNRNPNESATELTEKAGERAPIPTPPALGSAEYSYAYGQRPDTEGAKPMNKDEDEYHNYYSLDKDGGGNDSARYVTDGPGTAKSPSAEAPNDHDYFALEKSDESHAQDGGHNQVHPSPENSDDDHTYFPLRKTPERPSGNANSGYEVAKTVPTGGSEGEDASSPYDRLDRGEDKPTDEGALSDDYQHLKDN